MTADSPRRRLRRLRRELRGFRVEDTAGDLTYTIYLVVLTTLMYGPMLAQALRAGGATMPDAALPSVVTVAVVVGGLAVLALGFGRKVGPLRTTAAEVEHFLRGQVPPHLVLRRRALGAAAAVGLALAAVTAGLGYGADLGLSRTARLAGLAGVGGLAVGGLWVRVQAAGTRTRRPSGAAPRASAARIGDVTLLRRALDRLDPDVLLASLERWRSAGRSFMAGDARGAALRVGEAPAALRHRRLRTSTRLPLLVLARDWLGAQRALGRFVRSLVGAVAAATLLVLGAGPGSIGAAAAALVLFGATASWVEGLAAHADHAASGVVPGTPGRLFTLHLIFPSLVATGVLAIGGALAWALGVLGVLAGDAAVLGDGVGGTAALGGAAPVGDRLAYAVAVIFLAVTARAWVASQSVMPPSVLTPVVTPVGDLSPVVMGAWYVRGWLVVLGVVLGMRWLAPDSGAAVWTIVAGAALLAVGTSRVSSR
jgi:hypothetical protein